MCCLTIGEGRNKLQRMREILGCLVQMHFFQERTVTSQTQNPKNVVTEQDPPERAMEGAIWDRHGVAQGLTPAHYTS